MLIAIRVLEFMAGLVIVLAVLDAAIRTFVLPRGSGVFITRLLSRTVRFFFDLLAKAARTYEGQDRAMALYGPVVLLTLPVTWLVGVMSGFALMFHASTRLDWRSSVRLSGSALLTLGFAVPDTAVQVALVFAEAAIGLILVALLIAYLPTMYSAFSHREIPVTQLSVRAGNPPTPLDLLSRAHRANFTDQLDDLYRSWELWFIELEETHTSLALLNFFRSPNPHRSWLTASACMLDSAAIQVSAIDRTYSPNAAVMIRSGFLALQAIADFFQIPYDPDPNTDDPISIARSEFDEVLDDLAAAGVPITADRDEAWAAFVGWRVNYDTIVISLAGLIMAPYAPWVSDRSITRTRHRPPMRGSKSGVARRPIR